MAGNWMDDATKGFHSGVPLTRTALEDWAKFDPGVFSVVPDANWFMIRALCLHQVDRLANKFTLAHLKRHSTEWGGIPVAPAGRDDKFQLFGDLLCDFQRGARSCCCWRARAGSAALSTTTSSILRTTSRSTGPLWSSASPWCSGRAGPRPT